jgi:hypothetical protein
MTDEIRPEKPELAFYYPNPMWHSGGWAKNLILFFDGIALLVPEYMRDRPFEIDPAIATGLHENGLLRILETRVIHRSKGRRSAGDSND